MVQRKYLFYLLLASALFICTTLLAEYTIRFSGVYKTRYEKNGNAYKSYFGQHMPNWYYLHQPGVRFQYTESEFSYSVGINDLGLREQLSAAQLLSFSGKKILVLGDSFVEGVGASADSTMPAHWQRIFNDQQPNHTPIVINGGVAGSDIFFEYVLLRDKLSTIRPDYVVFCINYSDVSDYIWRGGFERFNHDGSVDFRPGPAFEPLYERSHLFRFLLHFIARYDYTLTSAAQHQQLAQQAIQQMHLAIDSSYRWCTANQVKPLFILQPYLYDNDRYLDHQAIINQLQNHQGEAGPSIVSLFNDFQSISDNKTRQSYFWPIDKHFNGKGYERYAQFVHTAFISRYPEIYDTDTASHTTRPSQ